MTSHYIGVSRYLLPYGGFWLPPGHTLIHKVDRDAHGVVVRQVVAIVGVN